MMVALLPASVLCMALIWLSLIVIVFGLWDEAFLAQSFFSLIAGLGLYSCWWLVLKYPIITLKRVPEYIWAFLMVGELSGVFWIYGCQFSPESIFVCGDAMIIAIILPLLMGRNDRIWGE